MSDVVEYCRILSNVVEHCRIVCYNLLGDNMNSFYETIFLKEDSSLEKKLEMLKKLPNCNKEDKYILERGINGEKQVVYHLNKSNIGMYVLRDVNFVCNDLKAQVDFVVITSHHCYFIECKNYNADIIRVDETRNFETSTRYGKKYNKRGIKSPLSQVDDQLAVFQKVCFKDQERVKDKFKDYFKTMVVFTNPENRLDLKKAPNDIKYRVLKVDNLIRQIEYDEKHFDGKKYSQEQMKQIADYILSKNVEINVEEIPESYYIQQIESSNISSKKETSNSKNVKHGVLYEIGLIILVLFVLYAISGILKSNNTSENGINGKPANNNKITYPYTLTDNQNKALNIFKSAYDDSQENGFTIIHTSVCNEINYFFENNINCNVDPIEVSYVGENEIRFFRPKSFSCYTLFLSDDHSQVIKKTQEINSFNTCRGNAIGIVEWDDNNQFYQKIGGYDKVRELAIKVYKEGKFNTWDFDSHHIDERGGNSQEYSSYFNFINAYFAGVTGDSTYKMDTTKENFSKMVEDYYYIRIED